MNIARKDYQCDTSGSCALVLLAIGRLYKSQIKAFSNPQDDELIFVNVGDSRAIVSYDKGAKVKACTYDHKPQFFSEQQRV